MTGMQDVGWTEARTKIARDLWVKEGRSAQFIADRLNVTRSSVIGKIYRMGLSRNGLDRKPAKPVGPSKVIEARKEAAARKQAKATTPPPPKPAPPPKQAPAAPVVSKATPLHLTLAELPASGCKWPYGDGPWTFCGCRRVDDRPYCRAHGVEAKGKPFGGRTSTTSDLARSLRRYL